MSSNLSSNTLFHYTKRYDNLIKILKKGLKPNHSIENYDFLIDKKNEVGTLYFVPMVCFCDIPLSNTINHINKYGNYAIGLSNDWGKKNGLNPVMYIEQNSKISQEFKIAFNNYNSFISEIEKEKDELLQIKFDDFSLTDFKNLSIKTGCEITKNNFKKQYQAFVNKCYSEYFLLGKSYSLDKLYNDIYYKDNEIKKRIHNLLMISKISLKYILYLKPFSNPLGSIKYYDEKEWRYIPNIPQELIKCYTVNDKNAKSEIELAPQEIDRHRELLNRNLSNLKFESSDVRYIIVKDKMKNKLIDFLKTNKKYKSDFLANNFTILTVSQIREVV